MRKDEAVIKEMTVEELKTLMDKKDDVILIDCREQGEWDEGHIPGAKLMPLSRLSESFEELSDPDASIIIQCRSGKRSMDACLFLQGEGYQDLTNLTGGILAWIDAGYQITRPSS